MSMLQKDTGVEENIADEFIIQKRCTLDSTGTNLSSPVAVFSVAFVLCKIVAPVIRWFMPCVTCDVYG